MNFLKRNFIILLCALSVSTHLQSETIEITNMSEIHRYLKPETLIVFDIDNTLLETAQQLGSDQWFYHQLESYLESGMLLNCALTRVLAEWHSIQFLTKVKIVEEGTDKVIRNLQAEGFKMIGLTTRSLEVSQCTSNQLKTLKIDLTKATISEIDQFFINSGRGVLFHEGILFTAASHKGNAFFKFLNQIGYTPSHVVFINDKATHIREIEEICEDLEVPFIGLRYGFLDEKVKNYQKNIAEIQYKYFNHILTDDEALNILHVQQ